MKLMYKESEEGMKKVSADAKDLYRYFKRKYRIKHPKSIPAHIPYEKIIDNKVYTFHSKHFIERRAQEEAVRLRNRGYYSRIFNIRGDIVVYKRRK